MHTAVQPFILCTALPNVCYALWLRLKDQYTLGGQEIVVYLLDNGAKVDVQDDGRLMPLHNACSFGPIVTFCP